MISANPSWRRITQTTVFVVGGNVCQMQLPMWFLLFCILIWKKNVVCCHVLCLLWMSF